MTTDSFTLVIPTFNESANIAPLVDKLSSVLAGRDYEIVFVDDGSSDGTQEQIRAAARNFPVRLVERRSEKGLASAVVRGFENTHRDTIVVMDADLQHPPEVVPGLVDALGNGADIAVASRYVAGGGCEEWSGIRKVISRGAILLAKVLLPAARKVSDPMSGFFALKRSVIQKVKLEPVGYKILLEVLVMGRYNMVCEVPFQFQLREKGASKLNLGQEYEYLRHLLSLARRSGELKRFIKFALVGASGVGVNALLLWVLTEKAGLFYMISAVIAIETSIITNFILNNFVTFNDRRTPGPAAFFLNMGKFNLVSLVGLGINFAVLTFFTQVFGLYYLLSNLIGIAGATLWNFFGNNWWTWK